jgi:hypothetical protein
LKGTSSVSSITLDDEGEDVSTVNFWGTSTVGFLYTNDYTIVNFYGISTVLLFEATGYVYFQSGSVSTVSNFTVNAYEDGNTTVAHGATLNTEYFYLTDGNVLIYDKFTFPYLNLGDGGVLTIKDNITIVNLDTNGGTIGSTSPYIVIVAVGVINLVGDIHVTSATFVLQSEEITWTTGDLYADAGGVIVNYVDLTSTGDNDPAIYVQTGGYFLNYGAIYLYSDYAYISSDDDTNGGNFINSGTIYLGAYGTSNTYLEVDSDVSFYQCPNGLLYFYLTSSTSAPYIDFAGTPYLDGNIQVGYSSSLVSAGISDDGVLLVDFTTATASTIFPGNVDTSAGSIANSFCWDLSEGDYGEGYVLPTAEIPTYQSSCLSPSNIPTGAGTANPLCLSTPPPLPPGVAPGSTTPSGPPPTGPVAPGTPPPPTGPVAPGTPPPPTGPVAPGTKPPPTGPAAPTGPVAPGTKPPTAPAAPGAITPVASPVSTATEKLVCASLLVASLAALVL